MTVKELAEKLELKVISGHQGLNNEVTGGYVSDLLSDVMGNAVEGQLWVTIQTHKNVMAIASLKDLSAIVFVNNNTPDLDTIEQSNTDGIPLLVTSKSTFEITGLIYSLIAG